MRRRRDLGMYVLSEDGAKPRYVYRGPLYVPPIPRERLLRAKALLFLAAVLSGTLVFLMGKLNAPSFRALYVMLPFLALVFGAGWAVVASGSMFLWKDAMTQREHRVSWNALAAAGLLSALSGGAVAAAVIVFLLADGGSLRAEWPLLPLAAAQVGTAIVFFLYIKRRPCAATPIYPPRVLNEQDRVPGGKEPGEDENAV